MIYKYILNFESTPNLTELDDIMATFKFRVAAKNTEFFTRHYVRESDENACDQIELRLYNDPVTKATIQTKTLTPVQGTQESFFKITTCALQAYFGLEVIFPLTGLEIDPNNVYEFN